MTAAGGAKRKRLRVFLGEDNEADIHLVRRAFRQNALDCDLEVARNGEDALSKLTNPNLAPPDLVLLDVNLPRVNGLAVLRAMRQRKDLSDTSVVILTSSDAPRDREEAASLGVRRFIRKASHLDDFLAIGAVVKEMLDPEHRRTPAVPMPVAAGADAGTPALPPPTKFDTLAAPGTRRTPLAALTPPATTERSPDGVRRSTPASSLHPVSAGHVNKPRRRLIAIWVMPFAAAAAIAIAGFFGHGMIEGTMLTDLKNDLESRVATTNEALQVWFEMKTGTAKIISLRAKIREDVDAVMKELATHPRDQVAASPAAKALRSDIDTAFTTGAFEAFVLLGRSGEVLLESEGPENRVEVGRIDAPKLDQVFRGAPRLIQMDVVLQEGVVPKMPRQLFVVVPMPSDGAEPAVALGLRLPLSAGFLRLTSGAKVGETGETHVFDRWGRMLTSSRFEPQLRAAGMLGADEISAMRIEARDPGGDITQGYKTSVPVSARPLTKGVARALTTGKGVDIEGFRDYRGVDVVAAWDLVPDVDLGVIFKTDSSEAFEALRHLRLAFWSVLGAVLASGILLTAGAAFIRRLHLKAVARQVGQYTLEEKIGQGAMGSVWRASHAMLRRPAAVKILAAWEPKSIQRFEREVQLTSQLSHPSTVAIYDYGRTEDNGFYYAMELLEGIDLADLVRVTGPLPAARVIHILRQVCGSLAEAHAKGLVHRDIKPSNIMLTVRGGEADVVKVVDFGLARLVDSDPKLKLTKDGAIFGTPGFIPPEALCEAGVFDARSDLYALGAVAYELLAARPPFDRKSNEYLWHCHIEMVPPPPSVRLGEPVPRDLEAVVMRLLAKDPSRRPQSAMELRELLDACTGCGSWSQSEAQAWWTVHGAVAIAESKKPPEVPPETRHEDAEDVEGD